MILTGLMLFTANLLGQEKIYEIKGVIIEEETNLTIPFAHVVINNSNSGTTSDENGRFTIYTKLKIVELQIHHTAFQQKNLTINAENTSDLTIKLIPKVYQTEEVKIKAFGSSFSKEIIPGKLQIQQKDILLTPSLLGEPDLVRTLQLLPGIQSVNEGNSGIYVRGGSPGQNFITFDDIELMNPSHLMGIYSVFNPFLVEKVDFYKGNAPVQISSRLASSIIVKTFDIKKDTTNWNGNIGNISSNITYCGNSKNKKWYTNIGFRRSYIDGIQWVADKFISDEYNYFTNNHFNFYDFNGKVKYSSSKSKIALSWYKGGDNVDYSDADQVVSLSNRWGNEGVSLSWLNLCSSGWSIDNVISYSKYFSSLKINLLEQDLNFDTDYKHYKHKIEFVKEGDKHLLRFGSQSIYRNISPQNLDLDLNTSSGNTFYCYKHFLTKLYVGDEYLLTDKVKLYLGGGIQYYKTLDIKSSVSESLNNSNSKNYSEFQKNFVFTFNYQLFDKSSIKGSLSHTEQDVHLASIASIPLPSDIWMPATQKLPSENGEQYTLGYFSENLKGSIEYGIEGYFKNMSHQLLYSVNYQDNDNSVFEDNFFSGKGKAWGGEIFIKKSGLKYNANISYTLGWARQNFDDVNHGVWYDAKYDRRHDLNVLGNYILNKKIDFGLVFIFASGNKTTLPVGRYWMMGDIANVYKGINNFRMPVYHRLDLSVNYHLKSNIFKESILNLSIINALNHSNPYFIYFFVESGEDSYDINIKAKQVSLFPILPSVSWKFKF